MLTALEDHHFLAVVGASGSGKSSLVQAGLLPALAEGFLSEAGEDWRFVMMRPGGRPFDRLAHAVRQSLGNDEPDPDMEAFTSAELRAGPKGFLEVIADAQLPESTNLLLLVDQFEEVFRFRRDKAAGTIYR